MNKLNWEVFRYVVPPSPGNFNEPTLDFRRLYAQRFEAKQHDKDKIWNVLCRHFFQNFIPPGSVVMDIAAGNCEFINNIEAKEKIAVDVNPDIYIYAKKDIFIINDSIFRLNKFMEKSCDIIFASNVFEHLDSKEDVISAINICYQYLTTGG